MSARRTRWIVVGTLAIALIGGGAAVAVATGGDDDKPLTGSNLEKATAAALQHTGGTVIETEIGDDGAAYGVEIRRDDGSVLEVNLDQDFNVIGAEADEDGPNDRDGTHD